MTVELRMSECGVLYALAIEGAPVGILKDKTFVVKDVFDVAGYITGGGSPDWLNSHAAASETAPAICRLLNAGASLTGKAVSDELALSLDGINKFYGTPLNPQLPDAIPGGSSSGSASAVACRFSDFALGSDTVGSIRVPSSYCGIFGMRPTHGAIENRGVMPLGPSFDTVGWCARDAALLETVGAVLLDKSGVDAPIEKGLLIRNFFDLIPESVARSHLEFVKDVIAKLIPIEETSISEHTMDACASIFGIIRSQEAFQCYEDWIETAKPLLSDTVRQRLVEGKNITAAELATARSLKKNISDFFDDLTDDATILILPSTAGFPPAKTASSDDLLKNRKANIRFTSLSVVSGLPQLTIPVEVKPGVKLGLSLLAARSADLELLSLTRKIEVEAR